MPKEYSKKFSQLKVFIFTFLSAQISQKKCQFSWDTAEGFTVLFSFFFSFFFLFFKQFTKIGESFSLSLLKNEDWIH